jgi:hypothetical protein
MLYLLFCRERSMKDPKVTTICFKILTNRESTLAKKEVIKMSKKVKKNTNNKVAAKLNDKQFVLAE